MRTFALHQDIYFETGASGGALYDAMLRRVTALSPAETAIVRQLERDVPIAEVSGAPADEVAALVDRLCAGGFGARRGSAGQRRDRYVPVLKLIMTGLLEPPLIVNCLQLQLTASCSLACAGCGDGPGVLWQGCNGCERWPGIARRAAWTLQTIDDVADQIEPLDIRSILFNGGDPFAEPALLEHALRRFHRRQRPPNVLITTNGTAVSTALLDLLVECGARLNVILLGDSPADYEQVCGDAAAFDAAMQALAAAQVRAIPFNVSLRFAGRTADEVARLRAWAATLGAQRVVSFERLRVDEDGGVRPAASVKATGPARVPQVTPDQFFLRRERHPCLYGNLAVAADLSVRPCGMISDTIGHLGLETLQGVLRDRRHERYWQMTKNDIAGCRACEFRFACADCAALDLAKGREPALHAAVCAYDPARAAWAS